MESTVGTPLPWLRLSPALDEGVVFNRRDVRELIIHIGYLYNSKARMDPIEWYTIMSIGIGFDNNFNPPLPIQKTFPSSLSLFLYPPIRLVQVHVDLLRVVWHVHPCL